MKHKNALSIIIFIIFASLPLMAGATEMDVHASIQMRAAITLSKTKDMDFGIIDYDLTHSGQIQLATNNAVTLDGASGLTINGGVPSAGDVIVGGDGQSIIEISCETSGILSDGAANNLSLQNVEYAIDSGVSFGAGTACSGLGASPSLIDFTSNPAPKILFGAAIDVSGNAITASSLYSTANSGGDPVTVRVVYQ